MRRCIAWLAAASSVTAGPRWLREASDFSVPEELIAFLDDGARYLTVESAMDCDFDTSFCGFNTSNTDRSWTRGQEFTPGGQQKTGLFSTTLMSFGKGFPGITHLPMIVTGPSADHTTGLPTGGYYIYAEASGNQNTMISLVLDIGHPFDAQGISFW